MRPERRRLDRMDRHFDDQGFNDSGPKTRPSELFQRNCWISFEPVEGSLSVLANYIGPHKIMWATDYPHSDGFFPGAPKMIRERLGPLSPEAKHQVLAGGAMGVLRPALAAACRGRQRAYRGRRLPRYPHPISPRKAHRSGAARRGLLTLE